MKALCAFYKALLNFLRANGKRIISICKITDQREVKIEFYGLMRHFESCCGYNKLSEVVSELGLKGDGIIMEVKEVEALLSIIDEVGVEQAFLLLCNKTSINTKGMEEGENNSRNIYLTIVSEDLQPKNP